MYIDCLHLCTYDIIAMIGTSDQSCWLAEACKALLLLLPTASMVLMFSS